MKFQAILSLSKGGLAIRRPKEEQEVGNCWRTILSFSKGGVEVRRTKEGKEEIKHTLRPLISPANMRRNRAIYDVLLL